MSDETSSVDLSDLIRQLEQVDDPSSEAGSSNPPARLIVATDWTDAAVPLTLLKAFRAIVTPGIPVQLAFAVPHEPTETDAACVHALVEGVDANEVSEPLAGLEILSFSAAGAEPYDSAVVPTGSAPELITQVGGLIVRMHDLVRRLDRDGAVSGLNLGDSAALRSRLAAFVG